MLMVRTPAFRLVTSLSIVFLAVVSQSFVLASESSAGQVQLTHEAHASRAPVWNPAGTQIAFESDKSGNWDIYLYELSTGEVSLLIESSGMDRYPAWSPDGDKIVFVSDRAGDADP